MVSVAYYDLKIVLGEIGHSKYWIGFPSLKYLW